MEKEDQEEIVKCLTAKEIKKLAKPEFAANPEKFYPVKTLTKLGFHRAQCPKCKNNYWRRVETADTCGDSSCVGQYTFIGKGTGIGRGENGKKITYADAWKGFEKSFTNERIPCTSIKRYPVVARWRNDVDFVAAGIYCFQPYCVTGEMAPPANPLIQPQFSARFNDLDNIGITGRHFSGFVMLGIQVFNYPDNFIFFKEEAVEFNYNWLTKELGIDPDEITFIEDVWAGGGNLGPSIEYFVGGLELGNMVFMQYKTFHDGTREELPIKIIDTGIGLERIPWLINGCATSYEVVFKHASEYMVEKLGLTIDNDIWAKIGPFTSQLDVDENDDIEGTWQQIADLIKMDVKVIKESVAPIKDMYVVLDHTRTLLMIISDGALPSNIGGGSNVRNILRRVFFILKKYGWYDTLGLDGLMEIFEAHKKDLEGLYGKMPEYKSFRNIMSIEYERWTTNADKQKSRLQKLLKKKKNKLSLNDWIVCLTSWGISAEMISEVSGIEAPANLHSKIAELQERNMKRAEQVLYDTAHLPETKHLFHQHGENQNVYNCEAKFVDVFANIQQDMAMNLVILNQTTFYPNAGGQQCDIGVMNVDGIDYNVVNVEQVGKVVMHELDKPLPESAEHYKDGVITCQVNQARRIQLRNHHTGTHIIFASCRKVLGPHVWQHGAKKTIDGAHLDITHYQSLTKEQEQLIENTANEIILSERKLTKGWMDKGKAELQHGFRLYQGGVVPGNNLRVVSIDGTDVEACCGTHCENTSQVGWIKLQKTNRISDGILRLYYVAGAKVIPVQNEQNKILHDIQSLWQISQDQLYLTADRFFSENKSLKKECSENQKQVLKLQIRCVLLGSDEKVLIRTQEDNPRLFFSFLGQYADQLKEKQRGVCYVSKTFVYALCGQKDAIDKKKFQELLPKKVKLQVKNKCVFKFSKKKKVTTKDITIFSFVGAVDQQVEQFLTQDCGFAELDL